MIERRPRALFIDLDGTLADSLPAMRAVYHAFLAEHGRQGDEAEFQSLNGPSLPEIVATLCARHALHGTPAELEQRYRTLVAERYAADARPAAGAELLLATAAKRGLAVWVVTSAERRLAQRFVETHGLAAFVAGVVSAEGLARSKPDPAIYRRALELSGRRADEVWAVEDAPHGVRAAQAAGLRTFALADVAGAERIASLAELVPRLDDCVIELLDERARVMATMEPLQLSPATEARVDALWRQELAAAPGRFDGTLLSFTKREGDVLHGRFVRYRYYLAQRRDPSLAAELRIVPLAVAGIVRCEGAVAIGRRSVGVTQYPGYLELVPSGGIDVERLGPDGSVDTEAQLLAELREEAGIEPSSVRAVRPLALAHDRVDETIDVVALIEVCATARAATTRVAGEGAEYRALEWVEVTALPQFVAAHDHELVPATRALCTLIAARG